MTRESTSETVAKRPTPVGPIVPQKRIRRQSHQPKPFYKNLADTLDEVGISKRQLDHWRGSGLFAPELDEPKQVFTQADIAELRFLKRLIVDLGFKIENVRNLLEEANAIHRGVPRFLDLRTGRLATVNSVRSEVVESLTGDALERWILDLIVLRLHKFKKTHHNRPDVYKASRDDLFRRVQAQDLLARAEVRIIWDEEGDGFNEIGEEVGFFPMLEDDPDLPEVQIRAMESQRESRINSFKRTSDIPR